MPGGVVARQGKNKPGSLLEWQEQLLKPLAMRRRVVSMPCVSVVIPTYNQGHLLGQAIESAVNQTYQDLEIIVVDDASTDQTPNVAAGYARGYGDKIRYLRRDANGGAAAARNCGILASTGAYIAFLDADDLWLPHKLERQTLLLSERPSVGWVYSDYARLDGAGTEAKSYFDKTGLRPPPEGCILPHMLSACVASTITIIVRASCFDTVGLFDTVLKRGQDYDMWIRLAASFEAGCVDEVLALYRQHGERITAAANPELINWYTWRVYWKFLGQQYPELPLDIRERLRPVVARTLCHYACVMGSGMGSSDRWRGIAPWCPGKAARAFLPRSLTYAARSLKRLAAAWRTRRCTPSSPVMKGPGTG